MTRTPASNAVDYFVVLSRARHLLPAARDLLALEGLWRPGALAEAIAWCGLEVRWADESPEDFAHLQKLMGPIDGDVYLVGDVRAGEYGEVRSFQIPYDALASAPRDLDLVEGFYVDLIGVTAPVIVVTEPEPRCGLAICPAPRGAPEDPRALEQSFFEHVDGKRRATMARLPPPVLAAMSAIYDAEGKIAAIKYLHAETAFGLSEIVALVEAIRPWWPGGFPVDEASSAADETPACSTLGLSGGPRRGPSAATRCQPRARR